MRILLAALALMLAAPAAASGHAVLQESSPERGAALDGSPGAVELRFNEPVEGEFGAVRVFDSSGREVQQGATYHPRRAGRAVAVRLPASLPDGGYTVTYRVISADSHPVSGGFVFSVGEGGAAAASVDELLAGTSAGRVTTTALGVARGVQYAAIALGFGALLFFVWAWIPALRESAGASAGWHAAAAAFSRRLRGLLLVAACAGLASAVAGILLQAAVASGQSAWSAADPEIVGDVLGTRFGTVWALGAAAWLAVGAIAGSPLGRLPVLRPASVGATGAVPPGSMQPSIAALALPLAALATLPALGGHASVQAPRALLLPLNVVHVIAISAWLGGVAVLVLALRAATSELQGPDRARLLGASVARFSALAGAAIAAILVTGAGQSVVYVESPGNLVDTAFGRAVLVKIVLFAAICALGWVNRNRLLPRLRETSAPGRAGVLLRRVLRAELAVGALVIAVTGALASYAPSNAESAGPFATSASVGPARLEVTVDPASTGLNEMHLYLFSKRDGSQYDATKELTVEASLPSKGIEPIELDARRTGPGHYTVTGATFGVAGDWTVEVAARVSEFDAHHTTIEIPIE